MDLSHLDSSEQRVLRALFELAQRDQAVDETALAEAVGLSLAEVTCLLASLDARGLVFAERVRLTMSGLATAVHIPGLGAPASRGYALRDAALDHVVATLGRVRGDGDGDEQR